jgi:multidrug efflux pump subunit AcrB
VVEDIREGPLDAPIPPVMYTPFKQEPDNFFTLVVRTTESEGALMPALAALIRQIDPAIVTMRGATMTARIHDSPSAYLHRSLAWLVGAFAVMALLVGLIELYVVMRDGMNALTVIDGVKAKLAEIKSSLPTGVEIVTGYDRSGPIHASINTLQRDLFEEAIIVSLVIIVFLFHFPSAFVPILTLPIAVLASFIPMYYLHVTSNIMSLGGLALAIAVLVDAAIVMVENGYRQLAEAQATGETIDETRRRRILFDAAKQVGPAIFFSLVIIVVSFLPVFLLEAQEGRMFRPLAWTKSLAVGFSSLLAITLVPVLMLVFIRGKLRPEARNPLSRITQTIYLPILRLCLRFRKTTLLLNLLFLVFTLPLALKIGNQFMPPLFEGSSLYMPTALPGISIMQASQLMQEQDRVIRSFPEVESVFGTVGRSESATDNAPLYVRHHRHAEAARAMAGRHDLRKAHSGDGCEAPVSGALEHLDHARRKPARHGADRHQDAAPDENPGAEPRRYPAGARAGSTHSVFASRRAVCLCRARQPRLLRKYRGQPHRGSAVRPDRRRRAAGGYFGHRWQEHRRKHRRTTALSD